MKQGLNCQIIDPCYEPEEDKEGEMLISNKIIETDKATMMEMEKKEGRRIGAEKIEIKITRNKRKRINNKNKVNIIVKTGMKGHNRMGNK